jgi:hypothetical protein
MALSVDKYRMQKSCNQFVPIKVKIQIKKVNPGGTFFRFIEKKHQYLQPFLCKKILLIQPLIIKYH